MTFIYFVITLGILIFIHEFGHFLMAKRAGILVEVFSLGFGPRLFGIKIGETDYRLSLLPFGGYVKMLGQEPTDEGADDPRAFAMQSKWARTKVVVFGPMMNFILALVLMPVVFMIGRSEPVYLHEAPIVTAIKSDAPAATAGLEVGDKILSIDSKKTSNWEELINVVLINPNQNVDLEIERNGQILHKDLTVAEMPEIKGGYIGVEPVLFLSDEPTVDGLSPNGPASKAGVKEGDLIVKFGGKNIGNLYDLTEMINVVGSATTSIVVDRAGEKVTLKIKPELNEDNDRYMIGTVTNRRKVGPHKTYKYGPIESVKKGFVEVYKLTSMTFNVLYKLVTLQLSYKVMGGPVVIAKVSAQAAASGLGDFLYFMCFLSLQLAVLNLLPIPVLDGGHLLFIFLEAIMRRPISVKIRTYTTQAGFLLLVSFMILITLRDIENFWGVTSYIKGLWPW